jgi:4-amino-4-deoxy-L-arabinose transferase-like glycosyltransferase
VWLDSGSRMGLWLPLCIAAALRFSDLGQDSLWSDEYATLRTAARPFWDIAAAALRYNAFEPPLYFWLLNLVMRFVGDSESSLRLLSALAGTLTVPMVWLLVEELTENHRIATLSAVLLALNPLHLWYSQEARPYALLVAFACAALLFLARAMRTGATSQWGGFVICTTLAMLTHVVGIVVPAVAWAWIALRRRPVTPIGPLLLASLGVLVLTAPVYMTLGHSAVTATNTGSPPRPLTGLEIPYTAFTYAGGYSFGPSVREIQNFGWESAVRSHYLQTGVASVLLLVALTLPLWRPGPARSYLTILFLAPLVFTFIGSAISTKAYNVRYTLLGLVGFLGLLSGSIVSLEPRLRRAVVAAVIGLFLWADAQWFFVPRYRRDDSRAAIGWLGGNLAPGSTVGVVPAYAVPVLSYYARKAGTDLCLVSGAIPPATAPDALVLGRLHHVPEWRQLQEKFEDSGGSAIQRHAVIGYQILIKRSTPPRSSAITPEAAQTLTRPPALMPTSTQCLSPRRAGDASVPKSEPQPPVALPGPDDHSLRQGRRGR